jgi:hypothetical protein
MYTLITINGLSLYIWVMLQHSHALVVFTVLQRHNRDVTRERKGWRGGVKDKNKNKRLHTEFPQALHL